MKEWNDKQTNPLSASETNIIRENQKKEKKEKKYSVKKTFTSRKFLSGFWLAGEQDNAAKQTHASENEL